MHKDCFIVNICIVLFVFTFPIKSSLTCDMQISGCKILWDLNRNDFSLWGSRGVSRYKWGRTWSLLGSLGLLRSTQTHTGPKAQPFCYKQSLAICFCSPACGFLVWSQKFTGTHYCHLNNNIFLTEVLDEAFPFGYTLHKMVSYLIWPVLFSNRSYLAQFSRQIRKISLGDYTIWFNNNSWQLSLWFRKQNPVFFSLTFSLPKVKMCEVNNF